MSFIIQTTYYTYGHMCIPNIHMEDCATCARSRVVFIEHSFVRGFYAGRGNAQKSANNEEVLCMCSAWLHTCMLHVAFKGMFSFQVKDGAKPYKASIRCMIYAHKHPFKDELECLEKPQQINGTLGVDETL